jgi:aryl-alcohol dehydrogenase-like predicted oxidoreductase
LSLKRLKTDYVDVLFLHAPDPKTNISITVQTFYNLQQQGLIRGFGICNASVKEAHKYISVINSIGIPIEHFYIQNYFNWARRPHQYWNDYYEVSPRNNINSVSYGLLARGLFGHDSGIQDKFSRKNMNPKILSEFINSDLKNKLKTVENLCRAKGQTLYTYALSYGYYLSNYSIVGIRTLSQLDDLIAFSNNLIPRSDFDEILKGILDLDLDFFQSLGDPMIL